MKKASISILLILICYLGYGQTYPLQQNVGNTPTTKVKTNALEGKIIITAFTDTSAANSEGYLKNYDGAVIKTTTPINALWYRVLDSAKWVQILPTGGGTGGIRAWLDGGNYNVLADGQGNAVFGTLGKNGIKFTTQAIPRFILDSAGILSETGSTIGIGYDPSNGNRLTQYSGGGSGNYLDSFWRVPGIDSNYYRINGVTYAVLDSTGGGGTGWSLTGNAGTTAGTNFLGTTDNISLMFKTNNTQRAIITAAGVFTTSNDAIINKLNIGNGYYSSSSNTLLGYYAGTDYIDGSTNHGTSFTYIGSLSGAYNFGSDNTAIGTNSLQGVFGGSNTTASRNTSVGSGSGGGSGGGGITTAKNNVFLGFNSGGRITSGSSNFFGGNNSGYSVTTGSNNIVIGDSAMYGTVGIAQIGSNNIILGSSAGYHAANISNSFYVNTIKQSSYADDTSKSLLYGKFNASTSLQSLSINAQRVYLPYLTAGVGTKAVRWDATRGLVLADTTVSGGGSGNYLDSFWRVPGIDSNYYRINGVTYAVKDSTGGGGVTSFSKTDNWGIISTVTNPTTTPNHTVGVDSSVVASKDYVDAKDALKLNISDTSGFAHKDYNLKETITGGKTFDNVTTNFLGYTPRTSANYFPTERAVPTISNGKYNFTCIMDYFPDGTIVHISNERTTHVGGKGILIMRLSHDQGQSWTDSTVIFNDPIYDSRNAGGGVTPSGRLIVFFTRYDTTTSTFHDQGYIFSDDKGSTWSNYTTVSTGGHPIFSPYGKMTAGANGVLMQSVRGYTGNLRSVYVIKSTDNGTTWGSPITIVSDSIQRYTETDILYLTGSTVIAVARTNVGTKFRQFISTDNGDTWSDQGDLEFEVYSPADGRMGWLSKYITPSGKLAVAFYYCSAQYNKLKVAYGYASDIIANVSGWVATADIATLNGSLFPLGYPAAIHPFGSPQGFVTFCDQTSSSISNIRFATVPAAFPAVVTSTTINANADNSIITGSNAANTLNAQSGLTFQANSSFYKLAINAPAAGGNNSNPFFQMNDASITIPNFSTTFTGSQTTANTIGFFAPNSGSSSGGYGGLLISGITNNTSTALPARIIGYHGSNSPTTPATLLVGAKWNGTTAATTLSNTEIIAGFRNWTNADAVHILGNGDVSLNLAGSKIKIATGSNASIGKSAAMTAGAITINTTAVTANSIIMLTPVGTGSGQISLGTITAGTSFVINSSDGADTRQVQWWIIN